MGPVYKIVYAQKPADKSNLIIHKVIHQSPTDATKHGSTIKHGQNVRENVIKIVANEKLSASTTNDTQSASKSVSIHTRGKRSALPQISQQKKNRLLDQENMAFQNFSISETEESSNSPSMYFTEKLSSPADFSHSNQSSSRDSINSDHDYFIHESISLSLGLDPVKYDLADHYMNNFDKPYIEILEQPAEMFRFRYISEMNGMHGSILGRTANEKSKKKTYPTVKLHNYNRRALIMCTLIQNDGNNLNYHPHCLSLRGDNDQANIVDPLRRIVGPEDNYTVRYQGLAIVHTAKKKVGLELYRKRKELYELHQIKLTKEQDSDLKIESETLVQNANMNGVRFLYVAYDADTKEQICQPVYSEPVFNLKCAETGALKITRMSRCSGSVKGSDEIYMFVEKVSKKNIKVRFYEMNGDERVWDCDASFSENDVHHQYGIVFRTPPYKDLTISQDKKVYVELYRPKDKATSEPKRFTYMASEVNRKRKRTDHAPTNLSSMESLGSLGDHGNFNTEIPGTVVALADKSVQFLDFLSNHDNPMTSIDGLLSRDLLMNSPMNSIEISQYSIEGKDVFLTNPLTLATDGISQSMDTKQEEDSNDLEYNDSSYTKEEVTVCTKILHEIEKILKNPSSYSAAFTNKIADWRFSDGSCLQHFLVSTNQIKQLDLFLQLVEKYDLEHILNYGNNDGNTALHIAVTLFNHDLVRKLLLAGCDPNILNKSGDSPLHLSVKEDNKECMVQLLTKSNYKSKFDNSLDINVPNSEGLTALHLAVIHGSLSSVSRLLCSNADPNIKSETNGRTALHLAVACDNLILVNYLLDSAGVQVDILGDDGETPLHVACTSTLTNVGTICERLLKFGADPTKLYKRMSAFDLASKSSDSEIYKVLRAEFPNIAKVPFIKTEKEDEIETSPSPSSQSCSMPCEEVKEEPNDYFLIDNKTSAIVAKSLETSGLWKDLAMQLGYSDLVSIQKSIGLKNPGSMLLNFIELNEKVTLKNLQEALENLNLKDAAEAVKAIRKD